MNLMNLQSALDANNINNFVFHSKEEDVSSSNPTISWFKKEKKKLGCLILARYLALQERTGELHANNDDVLQSTLSHCLVFG